MAEFRMPAFGDLDEGTLVEWRVRPGDSVRRGQVIAVVETDKAAVEVEVWEDGVVEELLVQPPVRLRAGTPLARLRDVAGSGLSPAVKTQPPPETVVESPASPGVAPAQRGGTPRSSPAARALARERGVDLAGLVGTGSGGAIRREDVEAAVGRTALQTPATGVASRAAAMAHAMSRSKREIPHYYLGLEVDVTPALTWMEAVNARRPIAERLLPVALFLRAVAQAAVEHPSMNGHWIDGAFRAASTVHLGLAVRMRQGGLVAPAILDVANRPLDAIMADVNDLVARARAGRLRGAELAEGTLTITNLGDQGVDAVHGVIQPPQVALVGIGRVRERPWVLEGRILVRRTAVLTLSADHRVSDGYQGGRFLATVADRLSRPEDL